MRDVVPRVRSRKESERKRESNQNFAVIELCSEGVVGNGGGGEGGDGSGVLVRRADIITRSVTFPRQLKVTHSLRGGSGGVGNQCVMIK